ncbi:MAG TPA: hypothetical protein VGA22_05300 [Gemmatimonadales bacterium]
MKAKTLVLASAFLAFAAAPAVAQHAAHAEMQHAEGKMAEMMERHRAALSIDSVAAVLELHGTARDSMAAHLHTLGGFMMRMHQLHEFDAETATEAQKTDHAAAMDALHADMKTEHAALGAFLSEEQVAHLHEYLHEHVMGEHTESHDMPMHEHRKPR